MSLERALVITILVLLVCGVLIILLHLLGAL